MSKSLPCSRKLNTDQQRKYISNHSSRQDRPHVSPFIPQRGSTYSAVITSHATASRKLRQSKADPQSPDPHGLRVISVPCEIRVAPSYAGSRCVAYTTRSKPSQLRELTRGQNGLCITRKGQHQKSILRSSPVIRSSSKSRA